jgi:hypothetical protein
MSVQEGLAPKPQPLFVTRARFNSLKPKEEEAAIIGFPEYMAH